MLGNFNRDIIIQEKNGVEFLQFMNLKKYESMITHCFTTRKGGVSQGECGTLNLGFNRNDCFDNVVENFRRICDVLGISGHNLVLTNQVHGNNIRIVEENDRGKGIFKKSDIMQCDGLITDKRGIALVAFFADCVPIFFYDKCKNVIGIVHSGWRGTLKNIACEAVRAMKDFYGSKPDDIVAAVGPSIGKCCFEVGEDVYEEFKSKMEWSMEFCQNVDNGKWKFDLAGIIRKSMIDSGLKAANICMGNICTKCNKELFYSYRRDGGKTGSLAGIIQII